MIVSKLSLKNWRNFRSIEVSCEDRVFIVGPNASGKSNLLDAFRFLRDIAKPGGGLQSGVTVRGGLPKVRCLSARKDTAVELKVELSDGENVAWRYEIGISQQAGGLRLPIVKFERAWRGDVLVLNRPSGEDTVDKLRLTQTHLEQINANASFRPVAQFLESIRYLHLVPQLLRRSDGQASPADDPFGRRFLEAVARTRENVRKARLRKIEAALKSAVPQMKDLNITKDDAGVPHLEAVYEHWRPNAGRQREDQFSDGTLRLIGLFWSLLEGDSPLLLEEPELSLNSAIVKRLPALFFKLQQQQKGRSGQIFITTHSWELLSDLGIGAEEVLLLTPGTDGTIANSIADWTEIREMLDSGLSVAEAALPYAAPRSINQLQLFL